MAKSPRGNAKRPNRKSKKTSPRKSKAEVLKPNPLKEIAQHFSFFWKWGDESEGINRNWASILILVLGVGMGLFFIHQETNKLASIVPASDECANVLAVQNFVKTGRVQAQVPPGNINHKFPEIENRTFIYPTETVLRAPILAFLDGSKTDWRSWSSLTYLWIICLSAIAFSLIKTKSNFPYLYFALLLVLMGASPWVSKSFHYVRYFPFYLICSLLLHFVATTIYLKKSWNVWLRLGLILSIAFIPNLFHKSGLIWVAFWGLMGMILVLKSFKLKELFQGKNLIFSSLGILIGIFAGYRVFRRIRSASKADNIDIDFNILPGLKTFAELNMNTSFLGYGLLLIVLIGGIWGIKKMGRYERALLSLGIVGGLIVLVSALILMGGKTANYVGYSGYNRYPFVAHAMYLLVLAGLLSACIKGLSAKIPIPISIPQKTLALFAIVSIPFLFNGVKMTSAPDNAYNFSILPQIKQSDINNLSKIMKNRGREVLIMGDHPLYMIQFPNRPFYQLGSYDPSFDKAPLGELPNGAIKTKDWVVSKRGIISVGTPKSFCKVINEHPDSDVAFLLFFGFKRGTPLGRKLANRGIKNNVLYTTEELRNKVCN